MQTPEGMQCLVRRLGPFGLTKAEKLQIVNFTPVGAVELYIIVEELGIRVGERTEEVLDDFVLSSLSDAPAATSTGLPAPTPLEIIRRAWRITGRIGGVGAGRE
ncbi:hypothetical protein BC834DRAFT_893456 [Gloeopeniophorella convolvens]|nr:hypothetical protein BC834DRAFT_893456 [Gloeopeniophorella convolvens]